MGNITRSGPPYFHAGQFATLREAVDFYNARRPHQTLDGKMPDTVYVENLPKETVAA